MAERFIDIPEMGEWQGGEYGGLTTKKVHKVPIDENGWYVLPVDAQGFNAGDRLNINYGWDYYIPAGSNKIVQAPERDRSSNFLDKLEYGLLDVGRTIYPAAMAAAGGYLAGPPGAAIGGAIGGMAKTGKPEGAAIGGAAGYLGASGAEALGGGSLPSGSDAYLGDMFTGAEGYVPTDPGSLAAGASVGAGSNWTGAMGDAANSGTTAGVDTALDTVMETGVDTASKTTLQNAANAGQITQQQLIDALKELSKGSTVTDALKLAGVAIPVVGAIVNAVSGGGGGQTVSQTKTTDTRPQNIKDAAQKSFDEFIDNFYGIKTPGTETPKSYFDRLNEDVGYRKGIEQTYKTGLDTQGKNYLGESRTAAAPYLSMLEDMTGQSRNRTGYFSPTSVSFGGQKIFDFVPRSNRDLATQTLNMGQAASTVNQGLADLSNAYKTAATQREYDLASGHLPNETQNAYLKKLEDLMWKLNTGGATTTETANVPGPSTWSQILQGLNAGADIYNKIYTYDKNNANTQALLDILNRRTTTGG